MITMIYSEQLKISAQVFSVTLWDDRAVHTASKETVIWSCGALPHCCVQLKMTLRDQIRMQHNILKCAQVSYCSTMALYCTIGLLSIPHSSWTVTHHMWQWAIHNMIKYSKLPLTERSHICCRRTPGWWSPYAIYNHTAVCLTLHM